MKKSFTFLTAFAFVSLASAQLTLTSSNTPHNSTYEAEINIISNAFVPQHGNNLTYDYSNVTVSGSNVIEFMPAVRAGFESSKRFFYGSAFLGGIPLLSEYYTHKDETGMYRTGSYKTPQAVGLGALSGNNNDTVHFPGNNSVFDEPGYEIKFPASYGSNWVSNYLFDVHFNLTLTDFGLNATPGYRHQYCVHADTVVGSGTLKLPGGSMGSFEYPVIVVKSTISYIDSTFLGGAPAPDALLSALGLTQGFQSSINNYYFYAADFEHPLLYLGMSSNWQNIVYAYYSTKGIEFLSNNSLQAADSKIYPNPIVSGDVLHVSINSVQEPSKIQILGLNGSLILTEDIQAVQGNSFTLQLPNNVAGGIYICQVLDANGAIILNNKISISE